MKTMRKSKTIPKHLIHSLPYEERLRGYEREKNELFFEIACLSADEVAKAHADLIRKWKV